MTQGERHEWEEKRARTSEEDLKSRRASEEVKKEQWPEELKEGMKRLREESKRGRLASAQPAERAHGHPQREKHTHLHKPPSER